MSKNTNGPEWLPEFNELVKKNHHEAMDLHYAGVWCTFNQQDILDFIEKMRKDAKIEALNEIWTELELDDKTTKTLPIEMVQDYVNETIVELKK